MSDAVQSRARPRPRGNGLWALELELLGRSVRIESPDEHFLIGLAGCFAPPDSDASRESTDLTIHVGPRPPGTDPRVALPIRTVEASPGFTLPWSVRAPLDLCSALTRWAALNSSRYYVFHAGAVAREGKALLLPAASGSGKSTTTAGLLRRGFQLLSDEIGALEIETERVAVYPRSLSLREDVLGLLGLAPGSGVAFPPIPGRFVQPEELGSSRAPAPARLALVALPRFSPGAETRIERQRRGPALMALLQSSCSQAVHKVAGLDWLIALLVRVPCYEVTFSDLGDVLPRLVDTFERHGEER